MTIQIIVLFTLFLFLEVRPVFAENIVLNEIMANPSDNTEWVEIYNPTNQAVDLANWKIKDGNSISTDDLTLSGRIDPLSFIAFDHNKGWLNDSGTETVTLLDQNSQTMDSYQYSGTTKGKSFGRQPDGGEWTDSLSPSKGQTNGILLAQSSPSLLPDSTTSPVPTPTSTPTPTPQSSTSSKTKTSKTSVKNSSLSLDLSTTQPYASEIADAPVPTKSTTKIQYRIASVAAVATSSAGPSAKTEVKSKHELNWALVAGGLLILSGGGLLANLYFRSRKII